MINIFDEGEIVVCINDIGTGIKENGIEIGGICTVVRTFGIKSSNPWMIVRGARRSMYTKDFQLYGTRYEDEEI
jgi:hypothetical protein